MNDSAYEFLLRIPPFLTFRSFLPTEWTTEIEKERNSSSSSFLLHGLDAVRAQWRAFRLRHASPHSVEVPEMTTFMDELDRLIPITNAYERQMHYCMTVARKARYQAFTLLMVESKRRTDAYRAQLLATRDARDALDRVMSTEMPLYPNRTQDGCWYPKLERGQDRGV